MKKAFILCWALCTFAVAVQAQDSLCFSFASNVNKKWCINWSGKGNVTVKFYEQRNENSWKIIDQFDFEPKGDTAKKKVDSANQNQLRNLLFDSLKLDQVRNRGGELNKLRKLFPLVGLSFDSTLGNRSVQDSAEYVALPENEYKVTLFKWSDSTEFASYLKRLFPPSSHAGMHLNKMLEHRGSNPSQPFPYKEALISLFVGLLMGAIISLLISRKKPAVVKEPVDKASVQPEIGEVNAPAIPPGISKILQEGIDYILKQADPDAKSTHIRSKGDVEKLLQDCAQHFERMARDHSDQQSKINDLTKSTEDKEKAIDGLKIDIKSKEAELATQKANASQAEELLKNEKNKHAETTSKLEALTEAKNTLDAEAAQVKMVATQIKKLVDDMYIRIDKLSIERRSHHDFKAEILKSFITISLASISYSNIRFGRYTNEDLSNMNMLAGKPPSDTSRRVGPSTIQSDVDFVAYFLYKLLNDHNAAGIEGFNYKGTYV